MASFAHEHAVVAAACGLVANLAHGSGELCVRFAEAGAVDQIVGALRVTPLHPLAATRGCAALAALALHGECAAGVRVIEC